mmetsp:Transcript_31832/g.46407  ORF Transcript_31832/g.46407 Transcript_31832/m.46407 type:complete len:129 (-) Transcript_31832:127-513(-)
MRRQFSDGLNFSQIIDLFNIFKVTLHAFDSMKFEALGILGFDHLAEGALPLLRYEFVILHFSFITCNFSPVSVQGHVLLNMFRQLTSIGLPASNDFVAIFFEPIVLKCFLPIFSFESSSFVVSKVCGN